MTTKPKSRKAPIAQAIARHVSPPPGLRLRWGKEPAALIANARTTYRTAYPVEATGGHFLTLSMALARALALFWITNACNRVSKTITVMHGNMSHCNKPT